MIGIVALAQQKSEQTSIAKIEVISRVGSSCLKSRKEEERVHEEDKRTQTNGNTSMFTCQYSLYRYAALPITCSSSLPKLTCQPLTFSPFLANRCLAMLSLCSIPLIALLVAGEVEDCSLMDRIMLGYHNISYLINASIYLVKGGRLGLMPGVLFHSCLPSFRHTGVMFLDFAFLTRPGVWVPLDSSP